MNLSLRTRLTVWYVLVLSVVLFAAGAAVVWLHSSLSLARMDEQLSSQASIVAGLLRGESDDEASATEAATEALKDLELQGVGIAVLSDDGRLLAQRVSGVPAVTPQDAMALSLAPDQSTRGSMRVFHEVRTFPRMTFRVLVWSSLAQHASERATLLRALWFGIPIALLAATIGGWSIAQRGLRPLTDMTRQAEALTGCQPHGRLAEPARRDELARLASAFNGVLDRLAGAVRVQKQFMADASHQLRTPVSIVRAAAQVTLSREERSAAEYREALLTIAAQTGRLADLINRMFMLALADADEHPPQFHALYLDELLEECVRSADLLASAKHVGLRSEIPPDVRFVGDEHLLREMLMNLLENAVRFTPAQGTIDITMRADGRGIRIEIADTGCGIAAADRDRVFERFVKLDPANSTSGGGLGLPIARWIAQAHSGSLVLEQSSPQGSRFVATFPVATMRPPDRSGSMTAARDRPPAEEA